MTGAAVPDATSETNFWKRAYEEHGPAILAFLRSRLSMPDEAEELMQETFVRAIRGQGRLREPERVRSYLFTTAHNLVRNHHRRATASPLLSAVPEREPRAADASDARARLRSLLERLSGLLDGMPQAHRQAFELAVLQRLPYREIAHRTGWSLALVKTNVHRARRRVVDGLAEYLGGDGEELT